MADTITLLETIGADASLRYAAGGALAGVLERAQASAELVEAVARESAEPLRRELNLQQSVQVQQSNTPGYGDEDDAEDGEGEAPSPTRQPDHEPAPEPGKPASSH
jgi:hypothetical protein